MKTGLFGGAFNPLHNGHMAIARAAIESEGLDRLIFIPSGNAPHKEESRISRQDRLEMVKLATAGEEKMFVSDYELGRSEVSYSSDTVEYFKKLYPDDELYFLMGDDSYNQLDTWHEPNRIFENATVLVFPRNGTDVKKPAKKIPMDRVSVSSSNIRERIRQGKDFRKLLPKEVFDYIIRRKIYKD
ncbi:MAG: nicotinate (nicotinamide) nucleotide adenylyltransferase [Clostridia bacterium]|nr:nicotinate (nicotinamide) nucleotide adenylyltransferase [Clostridia bacterium]